LFIPQGLHEMPDVSFELQLVQCRLHVGALLAVAKVNRRLGTDSESVLSQNTRTLEASRRRHTLDCNFSNKAMQSLRLAAAGRVC
jgi:hypothetical protein